MVRFAPLKIPLERRLQTAAILVWAVQLFAAIFLILLCLSLPILWFPFILYLTFIIYDETPLTGGRPIKTFRKLSLWKYFCDYFPLVLQKEGDLDPSKTYIFGYHPHGIIGLGAWGNFGTEGNNFSKHFPGIDIRVATLDSNFKVPFGREWLLSLGFVSVDKRSISNTLRKGPGSAILIVVGGAAEALHARPGHHDLTLNNRKGFVKLALTSGSHLVPVYSFGENDVYDLVVSNKPGSTARRFQDSLKKIFGFTLPIFIGRGIFNYDFGFLPRRKQMVSVVGKPIPVPKIENPTNEDIEKYHQLYREELLALFNKYKDIYAKDRKNNLRFVE